MIKQGYAPPMYIQVKDLLLKKIKNGEYEHGAKLPSERELSQQYDLSRMTARNALTELVREGWAFRDHGKGTFVVYPKIVKDLLKLNGFTQMLKEKGIKSTNKVLKMQVIEPTKKIANALNLTISDSVYRIERVRYGNDFPIAFEYTYIPVSYFPGLLEYDFNELSLYEVIEKNYNHELKYASQWLSILNANRYEAEILDIEDGAAVLQLEGTAYDSNDIPVEYSVTLNRSDRCVYYTEIWKGNEFKPINDKENYEYR
jgi:GntR family transcriptional regulator